MDVGRACADQLDLCGIQPLPNGIQINITPVEHNTVQRETIIEGSVDCRQYEQAIHESFLCKILYFHQFTKVFSLKKIPAIRYLENITCSLPPVSFTCAAHL